jgi:hypothetical protein
VSKGLKQLQHYNPEDVRAAVHAATCARVKEVVLQQLAGQEGVEVESVTISMESKVEAQTRVSYSSYKTQVVVVLAKGGQKMNLLIDYD